MRKRAEWFFRQRASANGHIPNGLLLQAFARSEEMVSSGGTFVERFAAPKSGAFAFTDTSGRRWGRSPPRTRQFYGNVSGRVTALAVDPCDATGNTVYAGGADGGVWVSFNALSGNPVTWQPLTDNEPSLSTGALALASKTCQMFNGHAQSNLILVGTGESNYALDNLYGAGVLRSIRRRPDLDAGFHIYAQRVAGSGRERSLHCGARRAAASDESRDSGGGAGNGFRGGRTAAVGRVAIDGWRKYMEPRATGRRRERAAI